MIWAELLKFPIFTDSPTKNPDTADKNNRE